MKPRSNGHRGLLLWILPAFILLVLFDQVSKLFASFLLTTSCNKGIIFGIFSGGIFNSVAPLAVLLFLVYFLSGEKDRLTAMSLILIIGGGVSNLLDRIFLGCVRDFISIGFWPSFNIADSAITMGVLLLIFSLVGNLAKKER